MMLQEAFSTVLKRHYVQVAGGCLFEDGLLLPWTAVKAMEKEKAEEVYRQELQKAPVLYNYNQTKYTGVLTVRPAEPPLQAAGSATEEVQKERKEFPMAVHEDTGQEKAIPVLIGILLFIGTIAMILSIYYTRTALSSYLPVVLASFLALIMVVFNSTAFSLIIIYRKRRQWVTAGTYLLLFIVSTGFSMTNTMQVNFNRYTEASQKSLAVHKDTNSARLQLASLETELATIEEKLKVNEDKTNVYIQKGWGITALQTAREKLLNEKGAKQAQQTALKAKEPDAVLTTDTKDRTFYDAVSDMLHNRLTAEVIQFLLSTLPALFIDIIAPFSMATAIQLLGVKKKEERHGADRKAD